MREEGGVTFTTSYHRVPPRPHHTLDQTTHNHKSAYLGEIDLGNTHGGALCILCEQEGHV